MQWPANAATGSRRAAVTFLLVADEDLQSDGGLHLDGHLVVVDETQAGQLQGRLQVLVALELHLAEVVQHPAGLSGSEKQYN